MKAQKHLAIIPECGVIAVLEGSLTRLYFDFSNPQPIEGETWPEDLRNCESIDANGRSHGEIISAIINDRYNADDNQALQANHELAKDPDSGISEEKRAEYLAEYSAYQSWRDHAKEIARIAVSIIENAPVAE